MKTLVLQAQNHFDSIFKGFKGLLVDWQFGVDTPPEDLNEVKTSEIGIKVSSSKAVKSEDASERGQCVYRWCWIVWSDMAEEEFRQILALWPFSEF
ncbi:hypothetical protein Tco_0500795 [Tanacetum coccineum]